MRALQAGLLVARSHPPAGNAHENEIRQKNIKLQTLISHTHSGTGKKKKAKGKPRHKTETETQRNARERGDFSSGGGEFRSATRDAKATARY